MQFHEKGVANVSSCLTVVQNTRDSIGRSINAFASSMIDLGYLLLPNTISILLAAFSPLCIAFPMHAAMLLAIIHRIFSLLIQTTVLRFSAYLLPVCALNFHRSSSTLNHDSSTSFHWVFIRETTMNTMVSQNCISIVTCKAACASAEDKSIIEDFRQEC